ncbi:MAG: hypothetical protein ACKPKO_52130, partial [Candidatus Fonsibacter sp.]
LLLLLLRLLVLLSLIRWRIQHKQLSQCAAFWATCAMRRESCVQRRETWIKWCGSWVTCRQSYIKRCGT